MRMTVMKHKFMRILHRLFYLEAKASFAKIVSALYTNFAIILCIPNPVKHLR